MEKVVTAEYLHSVFYGKRVFITGHTGFKGTWLLTILQWLGAEVKGYALQPERENDLYCQVEGDKLCTSVIDDIRDVDTLTNEIVGFEPHFIFHLAAQPLVRRSYAYPADTFMVNTQGSVHVLEAIRNLPLQCSALMITTDKVYENPERGIAFKEDDKLGGYDPYAASKAAAEIVVDSYRRSFFNPADYSNHEKCIASVRAGNVIGGGDFSEDRIVPDIVRSLEFDETVGLRHPYSIRPWQHVLEPLGAYLLLAAKMSEDPVRYSAAFNFGPDAGDMLTVEELTKIFLNSYGGGSYKNMEQKGAPHEANLLLLDSSKAFELLGWKPLLDARTAIKWTADWYADSTTSAYDKCMNQVKNYFGDIL